MEIRSFGNEAAPKVEGRMIEGYAVVFNRESRIMYDPVLKKVIVERILPGAITEELVRNSDVKALLDHTKGRMLARSIRGAGSLSLSLDEYGLKYRFDAPNTQEGDYAVEMIQRGDLFGSSFAYTTDEKKNVSYSRRSDGILQRDVRLITGLHDVAIVTDPAYFGTDVNVRGIEDELNKPAEPEPTPVDETYKQDIENLRQLSKN